MNDEIKNAVDSSQRAQRNYDLSKTIPEKDLETLIHAAVNSPSKQNETHYSLYVYTDPDMIRKIYTHTKKFILMKPDEDMSDRFGIDENGNPWQDDEYSVRNSQILANALFVYVRESGRARGGTHIIAKENFYSYAMVLYQEQINYSIGISMGELILSANLLGYKTGLCGGINNKPIQELIGTDNTVTMLVGVGYPNPNLDRRLHPEVLNGDIPERYRNGLPEERWRFPSFEKNIVVKLNGETI